MWLWLAPAVMLSQWGRQSRNSSVIASCDWGCITWGPITSCANNVLTDAGGLLLLLPANLWLIMLIKLEVNLPFKNAHPTPTEISRSTLQQGWCQRWFSLFLSLADCEAPLSLWFPAKRVAHWASLEEQSVKWCFLPHAPGAPSMYKVLLYGRWAKSYATCSAVFSGLAFLRICLDPHPLKWNVSGTAAWQWGHGG